MSMYDYVCLGRCFSNILEFSAVSPSHLILKHLISSDVSVAQLISPSVALSIELVLDKVNKIKLGGAVQKSNILAVYRAGWRY